MFLPPTTGRGNRIRLILTPLSAASWAPKATMEGSNYWGYGYGYSAFLSEVAVNHLKKARGEIWPKRSERRNNTKTTKMRGKKARSQGYPRRQRDMMMMMMMIILRETTARRDYVKTVERKRQRWKETKFYESRFGDRLYGNVPVQPYLWYCYGTYCLFGTETSPRPTWLG